MKEPKPLTEKEVAQLEGYHRLRERGLLRFSARVFLIGAVGGVVLVAFLRQGATNRPLGDRYPFLSPFEDALGTRVLTYLLGALMFGGGMAIVCWRLYAALMQLRMRLVERDVLAGRVAGPAQAPDG